MAATTTIVDARVYTIVFSPVKSTYKRTLTVLANLKKRINFWFRDGRRGGTIV